MRNKYGLINQLKMRQEQHDAPIVAALVWGIVIGVLISIAAVIIAGGLLA